MIEERGQMYVKVLPYEFILLKPRPGRVIFTIWDPVRVGEPCPMRKKGPWPEHWSSPGGPCCTKCEPFTSWIADGLSISGNSRVFQVLGWEDTPFGCRTLKGGWGRGYLPTHIQIFNIVTTLWL